MAEVRRDSEHEPLWMPGAPGPPPDGSGGGSPGRPQIVLALTLVVAIVVLAVALYGGLLDNRGNPSESTAPSAAAVAPSVASVPVAPSASLAAPSASLLAAASAAPIESSSPPSAPTSPGLIAVVGDDGALSTMDDGGGSRVSYPAPGVAFGFPAWSPDGSRIAVVGETASDTAIYVFTVPRAGAAAPGTPSAASPTIGQQPVVVYRSADRLPFYLYWTPDGHQIGFLAGDVVGLSLRIAPADGSAPLDGSGPASLIRQGAPLYFDWIDPGRLLIHVNVGSDAFTGEVGLDGASVKPALEGTGLFRSAIVNPDGRYVAYVRSETDGSEKLVVSSRGGAASHEMTVFGPTAFVFDPSGDLLASVASTEPVALDAAIPVGPLRLMDPTTGTVRTLLDGPAVAFFWSPDGRTMAAVLPSQPGDDQQTGRIGTVLAGPVVAGPAADTVAQAPGIAARLVFIDVSSGAARSEHVVHFSAQFVNQLLPYFDQYALSHNLWSPDSASILLPLVDAAGRNQLVVVSAGGSDARPVAGGARGFWSP